MAPSHDPFAPSSGPRRSGLLPHAFEAGARRAGATDAELTAIRVHWWKGTNDQRAEAERLVAHLTDAEWAEFIEGWRSAMEDPTFSPWADDAFDGQEGTSQPSEAQETPPADPATVGTDGLEGVHVSVELPDGSKLEDLVGELVDMGPVPEGMVGAGWSRPAGDVDGEPMAIGMRGFVPVDAKAAIAYITDSANNVADGDEVRPTAVADAARLVLAAELDRPPAGRRKKVLAACTEHLGPDEVNEQTIAAGEGLGG